MPSEYPPFINATGNVSKVLEKIKSAQTPERFTNDFLKTKLGITSSSAVPFLGVLKRMGLLTTDGRPTELYNQFRNPSQSKAAMAQAIKQGFKDLYERNEYAHDLDRKDLEGLIISMTGADGKSKTVVAVVSTFFELKKYANFDQLEATAYENQDVVQQVGEYEVEKTPTLKPKDLKMNLGYVINLNLPETTNIAVFNAIFKSLKEHLLD